MILYVTAIYFPSTKSSRLTATHLMVLHSECLMALLLEKTVLGIEVSTSPRL